MSAPVVGRFAPTPSGRLHLGNLLCALIAYLSVRHRDGRFLLRIEDLDKPRCPRRLCDAALSDLTWLGLIWDEPPLVQSERTELYQSYFDMLDEKGLIYPCFCTRAQLHAADAPNRGDDTPVYGGACARLLAEEIAEKMKTRRPAYRLRVPDETVAVRDRHYGLYAENLAHDCGDFILRRSDGYIGTLVDDLVTKGTNEPYRIMTSRSEYRLLHRQDNADERLSAIGHRIGLVSDERFAAVQEKYRLVDAECARLEKTHLAPSDTLAAMLTARGTAPTSSGVSLADLLRRPQITYADLASFDPARPELPHVVTEQAEIRLKYAGYIQRQLRQVAEFTRLEERLLPPDLDYQEVSCLRLEARQKLSDIRPASLGQASRISGVSPADITTLMVYLESHEGQK